MEKQELCFENFLAANGLTFDDYLARCAGIDVEEEQYKKLSQRIDEIYEAYPNVRNVADFNIPCALSKEESKALIEVQFLLNDIDLWQIRQVYFKGCADCAGYLKKLGLL